MKPLVNPVINLNGNSADDLLAKVLKVLNNLRLTQEAMMDASDLTHGRNFQHLIHGNDWSEHHSLVSDAQQAWGERRHVLEDLEHELTNMALDIQSQRRERERT